MTWVNQSMLHIYWSLFCISVVRGIKTKSISKHRLGTVLTLSLYFWFAVFFEAVSVFNVKLFEIRHRFMSSISWFNGNISWIRVMIWLFIKVIFFVNSKLLWTFQIGQLILKSIIFLSKHRLSKVTCFRSYRLSFTTQKYISVIICSFVFLIDNFSPELGIIIETNVSWVFKWICHFN